MEKMPYQGERTSTPGGRATTSDWRTALPILTGSNFTLRELQPGDGHHHDQVLWSILAEDWRMQRSGQPDSPVH